MQLAGYQQWIEVFDEDISKIWQVERGELQKAGMLFGALERELRSKLINLEYIVLNNCCFQMYELRLRTIFQV